MPQHAAYTLKWCEDNQTYKVYTGQGDEAQDIVHESPTWKTWLNTISSFAFQGRTGTYTVRKELQGHGEGYWYAYLRVKGKVAKRYLGSSTSLTFAKLERVAQELATSQRTEKVQPETVLAPELQTSPPAGQSPWHDTKEKTSSATTRSLSMPLVMTKLQAPRLRPALVHRSRLIKRLQGGMEDPLTLISAPAGFGKTTLLTTWLTSNDTPTAWLSIEPEDNDPIRFLTYLLASLQRIDRQLGASILPLLQSARPGTLETALALLINDLSTREGMRIVLVLDDYHAITTESIHRAIAYLVEHRPPGMHLVIATRTDPPLPLARLRARGQMVEVRAADLRFLQEEANQFLHTVMGLDLSVQESAVLQNRTEGWVAGLQFAALALRERPDISALLNAFAGTHRFVLDYLSEEVFTQQSMPVQKFLLKTCILDRLCGPLCDTVTGEDNGQMMLEQLDTKNLFLIALDDERRWYRYHHLFADMLRSRLRQTQPGLIPALHRRASSWYEQNELLIYAVQHALAASDFGRAASLILQVDPSMVIRGEARQMYLDWLNALPKEVIQSHPFLSIYHAYLLMYLGQLETAEARLQDAEASLQQQALADKTYIHRGQIVALRANIALYYGNLERCVSLSRQALELLPPQTFGRAMVVAMNVLSYLIEGDVTPAKERLAEEAVGIVQTSGNLSIAMRSVTNLARMRVLQGRLRQAFATYEVVTQKVPLPEALHSLPCGPSYYFGVGDIWREWNNLDKAEEYLTQGIAIIEGKMTSDAPIITLGYTSMARLLQARSEYDRAFVLLEQYAYLARQLSFTPHLVAQAAAFQAHIALAQGNIRAAIHWADGCSRSTTDEPCYPYEREHLTLARVRIAQGREDPSGPFLDEALALLERILHDAQSKARMYSAIEILVLKALVFQACGDLPAALETLRGVLVLAEPEGYARVFLDESSSMISLLSLMGKAYSDLRGYVQTLLANQRVTTSNTAISAISSLDIDHTSEHSLIDPLQRCAERLSRMIE